MVAPFFFCFAQRGYLATVYSDMLGGLDTEAYLIAADLYYRDFDTTRDIDGLVELS